MFDPTHWANMAVGTRFRFWVACLGCMFLAGCQIGISAMLIHLGEMRTVLPTSAVWGPFIILSVSILFSTVQIPIMSLVALRVLIREQRSSEFKNPPSQNQNTDDDSDEEK